jgi:hypothetical protein
VAVESSSTANPRGGGYPPARRGGQPADRVAPDKDDARAGEPDAADDLRRDPGRVEDDPLSLQHIAEPVLADQHEQRGPDPDQGVGAQARALLPHLPFHADGGRQPQRQARLAHLQSASQRRYGSAAAA